MAIHRRSFRRVSYALFAAFAGWTSTPAALAAGAPAPGRPTAFSHVAVKATHYEQSAAFYRDFLGFAEQGRLFYQDNGRTELVYLKINDQQWIEVFDAANVTHRTGAIYQVAFRTADAERLRQRVGGLGWPVPAGIGHGQMKNAGFTTRDPDGTVVEFVQYLPEGRTERDRGKFLPPTRIATHLIAVGLPTSRLSEAVRLFRDALGLQVQPGDAATTGTNSANAPVTLRVAGGEDRLELVRADAAPYFCLAVDNVDAARATLEQRRERCGYHGPLQLGRDAASRRTLTLTDPEGVRVVLEQGK